MAKKKKRMSKQKKILLLLFFVLTAIFLFMFYIFTSYVARIGFERITKPEFSFYLTAVKREMEQQANISQESQKADFWKTKIAGEDAINVAFDEALKRLVEIKIEMIKAKEADIKLNQAEEEELDKAVLQKIEEAGGDIKANNVFLKNYGVNVKEYRGIYREFRIIYNFLQGEQQKIQVTENEARDYYEQNKDKSDIVTVRHILFATMDSYRNVPLSKDKQEQAKVKADETLAKLRNGEDMASLADKLSEDLAVKENHGLYLVEFIGQNSNYQPEFKNWAISHKPGDMDIVKTANGYHVMKVEKRTIFDEVKNKAIEGVKAQRMEAMIEDWKKDPRYKLTKNNRILNLFK